MPVLDIKGKKLAVSMLCGGIFRIRMSNRRSFSSSLLEKYGIITVPEETEPEVSEITPTRVKLKDKDSVLEYDTERGDVRLSHLGGELSFSADTKGGEDGFILKISLDCRERLYGLGDESRESINKRGRRAVLWQANVTTYGPVPFLMSSRGWGIFINSTYKTECDLGCTDKNTAVLESRDGELDLFVFAEGSMLSVLEKYSRIVGKPTLLPLSAYGFTFVTNEETNARELMYDCKEFRKCDIPCDIIGLEPGWMETHYDYTTDKNWSTERFWLPWGKGNTVPGVTGGSTFLANLRKMGFKLSLWLCCDYDLLWEEEKECIRLGRNSFEGAEFEDGHFAAHVLSDKITKPGEAWFEHLEKFVDNGAFAFKLDGARQVLEHPDRLWAGKYLDREVHNVYPVIYAKQMKEGFERHTGGRRAMIYTAALYAGTQKYAATWAGDTGGGPKSLVSILNLALCGHSNASCDMSACSPAGVHFGFLAPWAQLNSWRYWLYPWLLGDENEALIRRYSKLRSSLIPYIYSMAHKAYETAIPLARPLCLVYPEETDIADAVNMYMLGDSLLVAAFDMELMLPHGRWYDIFKDGFVSGGEAFKYEVPSGYGGALFASPGAIWMTQTPKAYATEDIPSEYTVHLTPCGDREFIFTEDDGVTDGYTRGERAATRMLLEDREDALLFTLFEREGGYSTEGIEKYNIDAMSENDRRNIRPLPDITSFTLTLHFEDEPRRILINGEEADAVTDGKSATVVLKKELHAVGKITVRYEKQ